MGNAKSKIDEFSPFEHTQLRVDELTEENTIPLTMAGHIIKAKILRVVDGDTVILGYIILGTAWRSRCRCAGYNSPELRDKDPAQRAAALMAKDYLFTLVEGRIYDVEFLSEDKFGRELVRIRIPSGESDMKYRYLDDIMIEKGYGAPFMRDIIERHHIEVHPMMKK